MKAQLLSADLKYPPTVAEGYTEMTKKQFYIVL